LEHDFAHDAAACRIRGVASYSFLGPPFSRQQEHSEGLLPLFLACHMSNVVQLVRTSSGKSDKFQESMASENIQL
jgi:hypothetical protein